MPRKQIDEDYKATKARIDLTKSNLEFQKAFHSFALRWKARGYPDLYWEERNSYWDEQLHGIVYCGLYYELRDLCDRFGLWWLKDGAYIVRLLYVEKGSLPEKDALQPDDCPPSRHWHWLRMARTGLKLPRKHEWDIVFRTHQPRHNDGLTLEDIAEHFAGENGVTPETIRNAINNCKQYLARGGDLNRIGKLAGLTDNEAFELFLSYHSEAVRKTKPEK